MALSQDFLSVLRCPQCRGELRLIEDQSGLECAPCKLRYPIKDGIPYMLIEEAEHLS